MKLSAFITSDLTDEGIHRLQERLIIRQGGWGLTGEKLGESDLIHFAHQADILLVGYERVSAKVIENLPHLKLIGCTRSTPVNIDIESATLRRIPVLHTPGRNIHTAAEFTMGLLLSAAHHIATSHSALHHGEYLGEKIQDFSGYDPRDDITWKLDGKSPFKDYQGLELCGKTLGIIGLGKIGSRVSQLAHAFGMSIIAYSPFTPSHEVEELNVKLVSLENLLELSDFITIHASVTPQSCGMLSVEQFQRMKPGAYLISTSRAAIIDQDALIQALIENRIAGAALDVFWVEPLPANHPLLHMKNVTLTPHLAGATRDVVQRHTQMIIEDLFTWLDGQIPKHVANPQVFD